MVFYCRMMRLSLFTRRRKTLSGVHQRHEPKNYELGKLERQTQVADEVIDRALFAAPLMSASGT
jgi:hypothetical protein